MVVGKEPGSAAGPERREEPNREVPAPHPDVAAVRSRIREILGDRVFPDVPFDRAEIYEDRP